MFVIVVFSVQQFKQVFFFYVDYSILIYTYHIYTNFNSDPYNVECNINNKSLLLQQKQQTSSHNFVVNEKIIFDVSRFECLCICTRKKIKYNTNLMKED